MDWMQEGAGSIDQPRVMQTVHDVMSALMTGNDGAAIEQMMGLPPAELLAVAVVMAQNTLVTTRACGISDALVLSNMETGVANSVQADLDQDLNNRDGI